MKEGRFNSAGTSFEIELNRLRYFVEKACVALPHQVSIAVNLSLLKYSLYFASQVRHARGGPRIERISGINRQLA